MQINHEEDDRIEVQMAPLIDCVFLLLIFFLVATTLKKIEPELPLELPYSDAALQVSLDEDRLVVGIDALGKVYVNGQPATNTVLHETLRRRAAEDPEQEVRLDVDRRTPFEYVVRVVELCTFEGLTDVGFHTAEPKQR